MLWVCTRLHDMTLLFECITIPQHQHPSHTPPARRRPRRPHERGPGFSEVLNEALDAGRGQADVAFFIDIPVERELRAR